MEHKLVRWSFAGFAVLSLAGFILRLLFVTPIPGLNYSFLLHAHSHFAFAGWIFTALAMQTLYTLNAGRLREYRWLFILTMVSAYGMLICFTLQGYRVASISFSTLFILINYYYSYLILTHRNFKTRFNPISQSLIKSSVFFLCLSSLGPFALGFLMAKGMKGTPYYNNAIYFYLHFHMNGWMLLSALGLISNNLNTNLPLQKNLHRWLRVFILATLPSYLLFILWSSPPLWLTWLAGISALLTLFSWIKILPALRNNRHSVSILVKFALICVSLKVLLQTLICIPAIGTWVFSNRNLIIGYIHLLTLGSVMPLILEGFSAAGLVNSSRYKKLNGIFLGTVVLYLALLFIPASLALLQIYVPALRQMLLVTATAFLIIAIAYMSAIKKTNEALKKHKPPII